MTKSIFTDAYASLLQNLITLRRGRGLSQVELGRRLGKEQTFISRIERGERRLDVLEFYAWAKALGEEPASAFGALTQGLPDSVEI